MKKLLSLFLSICILLTFAACGSETAKTEDATQAPITQAPTTQPTETTPPETEPLPAEGYKAGDLCYGMELPIVTAEGETDASVNPQKTGKVTVLNFWGTWCGPCKSEMPDLDQIARDYSDSLTVIAIHSLEEYKKMPAYIAANYPDSPIIFSWETTGEYVGEYFAKFQAIGYPHTVVMDERGVITQTHTGMMTYAEMAQMVEKAGAVKNPVKEIPTAVEDAYTYSFQTDNINTIEDDLITFCYHIPRINITGDLAAGVNQLILEKYRPMVAAAEARTDDIYDDFIGGLVYESYLNGDVLSLVIQYHEKSHTAIRTYDVYNISVFTGELLTNAQLYETLGMTEEEGANAAVDYLRTYWEGVQPTEMVDLDYIDSMIVDTLSAENIAKAQPFLDENGNLMFAAEIAIAAGAGYNRFLVNEIGEIGFYTCQLSSHD